MLVTAVHAIVRKPGKIVEEVAPGTTFEVSQDEKTRLEARGAVREPTETELALYKLDNPGVKVEKQAEPEKPKKAAKAANAKKSEPEKTSGDDTDDTSGDDTDDTPEFVIVSKGGGRFCVENQAGEKVSGEEWLTKEQAETWVAEKSAPEGDDSNQTTMFG